MDYKEKVKYADEVLIKLKGSEPKSEIENYLAGNGLKKYDIDKVIFSAKKALKLEYSSTIKELMVAGTLGDNLDRFDDLSTDLFEEIQYELIDDIVKEAGDTALKRFKQGVEYEEISQSLVNEYFTEDHLEEVITQYENKVGKKKRFKNRGWGAIILGVALTIISKNLMGDSVVLFYGLVIYGIWNLFKSNALEIS